MKDPKIIAVRFNECITNRNINGLAQLMAEDHRITMPFGEGQGRIHEK